MYSPYKEKVVAFETMVYIITTRLQFLDFKLVLGIQYWSKAQDVCVFGKKIFAKRKSLCVRVNGTNIIYIVINLINYVQYYNVFV